MAYRNEGCEKYTSNEIQSWMNDVEYQIQQIKNNTPHDVRIPKLQKQFDDLHADLILKKQEEAKKEMKELLNRLLELVDST